MNLIDFIQILLPEWILLVGACAAMLVGVSRRRGNASGPVSVLVALAALAAAVWCSGQTFAFNPPGLIVNGFVHYVRIGGLAVGVLILLCNLHLPVAEERGEFFSLILFSICGLLVTASANNLLVLFLAIELVSVPTYVLVSLSRTDLRASEAGVKYFFLGALAAAMMVYGFSFLYGALGGTGTLVGADSMAEFLHHTSQVGSYAVIGLLLALVGVLFKVAAVPFHVYVPDVYEGAAAPVTGLLGFLPKFAGFVAAVKILSVFNWQIPVSVMWMLWIVAALTMTVGNTLALLQSNVKRILAYSSIAHSGYMLIGILVGPAAAGDGPMRDGVAAMLFYMVVYGTMNLGAFAVLSALRSKGQPIEELSDCEGLSQRHPGLAIALAVCVFSLMGFPPTAGLLGKVYIFSSAFSAGDSHPFAFPLVVLAVIGVINSAIAAAYYLRIVAACYVKNPRVDIQHARGPALNGAIALCAILMLLAFAWPRPISRGAHAACTNLSDKPAASVRLAQSEPPATD